MSGLGTTIQNGVTLAGDAAIIAAPVVAIYNPAVGAALATLAPVVENFILTETQVLMNLKADMTKDDMVKALQASKSANWNIKPLEIPGGTEVIEPIPAQPETHPAG